MDFLLGIYREREKQIKSRHSSAPTVIVAGVSIASLAAGAVFYYLGNNAYSAYKAPGISPMPPALGTSWERTRTWWGLGRGGRLDGRHRHLVLGDPRLFRKGKSEPGGTRQPNRPAGRVPQRRERKEMKHVFGNVMKCAAPFAALILASCHVIWSDFSNPYDLENMTIRTYAGKGGTTGSYSGDNESAASAGLSSPVSIAFDSADNLYISDSGNDRVRKVSAATGIITTVAGGGTGLVANGVAATSVSVGGGSLQGIALDSSGNLYIATSWSNQILKVDAAGTLTIVAGSGGLSSPMGVAVDSAGDLYIADSNNYRVLRVDASTSVITTVAGNGTSSYSGDGGPATSAGFYPRSIALDSSGDIFITDTWATRIREVDASTGIISWSPPGSRRLGQHC